MPQAVCLFAVCCCLSHTACSFLRSHSKSITLITLDNGVSAETNLFRACSMGVGYEPSGITLILVVPINPATTVQGIHMQGQHVSPKPHIVTIPGANGTDAFCKKKPLWKMLFYCFFGDMDLLRGTDGHYSRQ